MSRQLLSLADINVYWTFGGDLFAGDAEDEDAPLVQVRFCNEARELSKADKVKVLKMMQESASRAIEGEDGQKEE